MKNKQGIEIKIGQRWQNCDHRYRAQVKTIRAIDEQNARIQWAESPCNWYSVRRLYPHSTGYKCLDADPKDTGSDQYLKVSVEGRELVMRIGIERLAGALNKNSAFLKTGKVVYDANNFAQSMAEMLDEIRDSEGYTRMSKLLFTTAILCAELALPGTSKEV